MSFTPPALCLSVCILLYYLVVWIAHQRQSETEGQGSETRYSTLHFRLHDLFVYKTLFKVL